MIFCSYVDNKVAKASFCWLKPHIISSDQVWETSIPANCPVFGGTVQFFEVSDSKKLDCPVFFLSISDVKFNCKNS